MFYNQSLTGAGLFIGVRFFQFFKPEKLFSVQRKWFESKFKFENKVALLSPKKKCRICLPKISFFSNFLVYFCSRKWFISVLGNYLFRTSPSVCHFCISCWPRYLRIMAGRSVKCGLDIPRLGFPRIIYTVCGPLSGHKSRKHVFHTSEGLQSAEINTKSSFIIQETGVKLTAPPHSFYLSYNKNGGSLSGSNFRPVGPVSGHERSSAILHTNQATIASCFFKSFW